MKNTQYTPELSDEDLDLLEVMKSTYKNPEQTKVMMEIRVKENALKTPEIKEKEFDKVIPRELIPILMKGQLRAVETQHIVKKYIKKEDDTNGK